MFSIVLHKFSHKSWEVMPSLFKLLLVQCFVFFNFFFHRIDHCIVSIMDQHLRGIF